MDIQTEILQLYILNIQIILLILLFNKKKKWEWDTNLLNLDPSLIFPRSLLAVNQRVFVVFQMRQLSLNALKTKMKDSRKFM